MTDRPSAAAVVRERPGEFAAFDHVLTELSAELINLPADRIDKSIERGLRNIIDILDIDRCALLRLEAETAQTVFTHAVARKGVETAPKSLVPRQHLPHALAAVMAGDTVAFTRLDELPPEASIDRVTYEKYGQKSHLVMPLWIAGEVRGLLSFGSTQRERAWSEPLQARLRRLAEVLGNALARKRAQEELDHALEFERLTTGILASLLLARTQDGSKAIDHALRDIARFLKVERASLWERLPGRAEFRKIRRWTAPGVPTPKEYFNFIDAPWISAQLVANQVVRLSRLDDLPESATTDRATLRSLGVGAQLIVPHCLGGVVDGALAVAAVEGDRQWPAPVVSGLQLLTEVFSSLNVQLAVDRERRAAEAEAALWRERLAHIVRVHAVGEMSGALAHEITQPMGAIENYAHAAKRRLAAPGPDVAKVASLLDSIIQQASRAGDVISRLRTMVRRHDLELAYVDLERVIRFCADTVRMDCELRNIELAQETAPDIPFIVADEVHIQQVVLNLLRNAMEAMDPPDLDRPRIIRLWIRHAAGIVSVGVEDAGTGIAAGDLERVFESFYTSKARGLGIGLAISRKLIEAHGGKLWASHRPAGGAVFEFTLPAATIGN
ncbi:sensor histidine kinase [Variovorax rhizosphaerae]|uniref:histidine kinase n=1 Tax=Variovorax rhizosphaerae TaxID=1836200 RepID=A0ABU8WTM9_9BURK